MREIHNRQKKFVKPKHDRNLYRAEQIKENKKTKKFIVGKKKK